MAEADATSRGDGRLPLIVVGGFLGAGKSTWLRHQLFERRFGRVWVLVNEAAETPVDNLLLGRADAVEVLAGGCACCDGRVALIHALRRLCNRADARHAPPDTIVLETSGLADPAAIAAAIAGDPVLVRRLAVARTIVLVDARNARAQLAAEPLARAQIEAADEIVITRAATNPAATNARLAATLRGLAPGAVPGWAEFGVAQPVAVDPAAAPWPLAAATAREPIRPHRLDVREGGGWVALSAWLSALLCARGDDIVRVKGVVRTPAGRLLLQSVRRHVQPPEILPDTADGAAPADDVIVLIGRGIDGARLGRSWRRFALGE